MPAIPAPSATWARLITPYSQWNRHGDEDGYFCNFLIQSGIGSQETAPRVDAAVLDDLCRHVLIFATDFSSVVDFNQLENLREYVYRGGLLYVEVCHDKNVTPRISLFHEGQMRFFTRLFPSATSTLVLPGHAIYHAFFPLEDKTAQTEAAAQEPTSSSGDAEFYAIYDDDRVIGIIGQKGLRCAWGWKGHHTEYKMQLSANVIAFAHLQTAYR